MNTSDKNMLHSVEKIAYISILFMTSIGIMIAMFFSWIGFCEYNYDYGFSKTTETLSFSEIFGELTGDSSTFFDTYTQRSNEAFLVTFIILFVLSIISMVLICAFLIRLGTTIKNPKGVIIGRVAMVFTLIFLSFNLLCKIISNIVLHDEHGVTIDYYEVSTAPYVILVLCLITFVMIKRLKRLKVRMFTAE